MAVEVPLQQGAAQGGDPWQGYPEWQAGLPEAPPVETQARISVELEERRGSLSPCTNG